MKAKQIITLFFTIILTLSAAACGAPLATQDALPTQAATAMPQQTSAPTTWQAPSQNVMPVDTEMPRNSVITSTEKVRVAALAGPTGIGLTYLTKLSDVYTLDLFTAPDQATAKILSGDVDIAAVPVNLASVLYNKTEGKVTVIAVNTLGVLYFLENGDTVHSAADLAGKTIYSTGQASTPQYILEQILSQYGLERQVNVEYIADNTELISKLVAGDAKIALLPEPHVSIACAQSENVRVALSANDLWQEQNDGTLVQGVYIVRTEYLKEHHDAVDQFLSDARVSADKVLTDENASADVVEMGIIGKEPIAKRAIPNCNIVLKTGEEMHSLVACMLEALYEADAKSIGGKVPDDAFYYVP